MRKKSIFVAAIVLAAGACGASDGAPEPGGNSDDGRSAGGVVVNPQPPGQAIALVDGLEYTLTEPGGFPCSITPDAISIAFRIGDNEVILGGGVNLYDTGWSGGIDLRVANPDGEQGPISYFPDPATIGNGIAIDGESMSYVGPMQKRPANDGSNPPPVNVGEGSFSATCP